VEKEDDFYCNIWQLEKSCLSFQLWVLLSSSLLAMERESG